MTKITDIIDERQLNFVILNGYVKSVTHPTLPYTILNYTPKTQFERAWSNVTRASRGLIFNHETYDVVARPFAKFHNYEELDPETLDVDADVVVTDKADGSLGILYRRPDGAWAIATRGSFTSEQAIEATTMLYDLYDGWSPPFKVGPVTVLFEIIYPGNRVVLDYGQARELRLIDAVWIDRGWPIASSPDVVARVLEWPGPVVEHLGTVKLKTALARLVAPRINAEGVVLRFLNTDKRVKLKQGDYVTLHRVLTRTSARSVWEYLAVNACRDRIREHSPKHWGSKVGIDPKRAREIMALGAEWPSRLLEKTPDEFYQWVQDVMLRLKNAVYSEHTYVARRADELRNHPEAYVDARWNRAAWFALVKREEPEYWGLIVAHHDGTDIVPTLWRRAYPGVEVPFKMVTEDTA
jgi:RNA ligase